MSKRISQLAAAGASVLLTALVPVVEGGVTKRPTLSALLAGVLFKDGSVPLTGDWNVGGVKRITGLLTPASGSEPATKGYVDDQGAGWPVQTETSTAKTFAATDLRKYTTTTQSGAVTFTVPPDTDVSWPDGALLTGDQGGLGQITFAQGAGVTIETPDTLKTFGQFAPWALKRVGSNRWRLCGKLEAA